MVRRRDPVLAPDTVGGAVLRWALGPVLWLRSVNATAGRWPAADGRDQVIGSSPPRAGDLVGGAEPAAPAAGSGRDGRPGAGGHSPGGRVPARGAHRGDAGLRSRVAR